MKYSLELEHHQVSPNSNKTILEKNLLRLELTEAFQIKEEAGAAEEEEETAKLPLNKIVF